MRDALSMFDQIAGFGGGQVTVEGVRQNLNLLNEDEYFRLLAYVVELSLIHISLEQSWHTLQTRRIGWQWHQTHRLP